MQKKLVLILGLLSMQPLLGWNTSQKNNFVKEADAAVAANDTKALQAAIDKYASSATKTDEKILLQSYKDQLAKLGTGSVPAPSPATGNGNGGTGNGGTGSAPATGAPATGAPATGADITQQVEQIKKMPEYQQARQQALNVRNAIGNNDVADRVMQELIAKQ